MSGPHRVLEAFVWMAVGGLGNWRRVGRIPSAESARLLKGHAGW